MKEKTLSVPIKCNLCIGWRKQFIKEVLEECEKHLELNKINYNILVKIIKQKAGSELI